MNINIVDRIRAASIHLGLSIIVVSLFFSVIYFIWFPSGLVLAGALTGLKIVLLVDLVLGPLLTLVVFNKKKKSLKWDLAIIVAIQLAALVYGGGKVFNERPVTIVMGTDAVHLITASDLASYGLPEKYRTYTGPEFYYLDVENDLAKIMPAEMTHDFFEEYPYIAQHKLYKGLREITPELYLERADLLVGRQKNNTAFKKLIGKPRNEKECKWLPLTSKHIFNFGFVCFNQQNGILKTEEVSLLP